MKKQIIMKIIVNKHTLAFEEKKLRLQFKKTYLDIQKALLSFFNQEVDIKKKEEIKSLIKETGQNYKRYMERETDQNKIP